MESKRFNNKVVVRIDRGEEIVSSLMKVVNEYEIRLGTVQALGATNYVKVGLFNVEEKKYYSNVLTGDMEITSLIGNISQKDGEPYLHLHINVADGKQNVYGGHLNECVISATCELFIDVIDGEVNRRFAEETGLNLIKF
ncbi:MAG: PPC domain-containing DNA-binding protein [Erysipelotrichaceae bacterium]|jgi:predicted DNA-binding protein with PD1-like motif